jgi:hypothetical protein
MERCKNHCCICNYTRDCVQIIILNVHFTNPQFPQLLLWEIEIDICNIKVYEYYRQSTYFRILKIEKMANFSIILGTSTIYRYTYGIFPIEFVVMR